MVEKCDFDEQLLSHEIAFFFSDYRQYAGGESASYELKKTRPIITTSNIRINIHI